MIPFAPELGTVMRTRVGVGPMRNDPMIAMDEDGHEVHEHTLLARPTDGNTVYSQRVLLRRLVVDGRHVEALEEHWHDDGLRGHTLVFHAADVAGSSLRRTTAEDFGIDLDAPRSGRGAGSVSVNRSPSQFVFATGAFYAEYRDD
jgi:hypothetical protein